MNFDGFLGNDILKKRLSASFAEGKISHSYLLNGPEGSGKHILAELMAAAMECTSEKEPGCGMCGPCRKARNGIHPDIIHVKDPDHREISVEIMRGIGADAYIRPNEGARKVYIIEQDLSVISQNALLKILEEPPEYAVFLILTSGVDKILPTVQSRCVRLNLVPVEKETGIGFLRKRFPDRSAADLEDALAGAGGFLGAACRLLEDRISESAESFAEHFAARNRLGMLSILIPMEKNKREQVLPEILQMRKILCSALFAQSGVQTADVSSEKIRRGRTGAEILSAVQCLEQAADALNANASVGTVIGWLTAHIC